ncbi:hypothetical protein [Flavobacterium praedii]|uniref:hypothetical protein n=1 Tax=Flavobacterium praedii TaxID=3002900 RepID=UPI002481B6C6|nr:hypothetical protein [Flavobacterium praedii]
MKTITKKLTCVCVMFFITMISFAQRDFNGLIDMKASYLDQEMRDRGYQFIKTDKSGDSAYQNWYNSSKNKCVTVKVYDGRIESIVNSTLEDCGKGRYSNGNNYNNNYNNHNNSNKYNNNKGNFNYGYLSQKEAVWAYGELSNNGFQLQKTHQQGGNTYKIWFNDNSNQCLKTTSRNKLIAKIEPSSNCNQ